MDTWNAVFAGLQLVVGCNSAVALWLSPRAVLWISERLREQARERDEKRTLRLRVFLTLMQDRATPHGAEAVKAFNAIDVAFADEPNVRRAWERLLACGGPGDGFEQGERLSALLDAMAASLGFDRQLGARDFARIYVPEVPAETNAAIRSRSPAA